MQVFAAKRFCFSIVIGLALASNGAKAEISWRDFAEGEYGKEKGARVYEFLKPLCGECETLVAYPGISAHFAEIQKKFSELPRKSFTNPRECLDWITRGLGTIRVYRGLALKSDEYQKIIAQGSMSATRAENRVPQESKKQAVLEHLLKMPGDATPVLSVTSYPDVAAIVAKGYAEHIASFNADPSFRPDTKVYLFEFELPRIEVWGFSDAFGSLPAEITPNGTTMTLENNGSKTQVKRVEIDQGASVTTSWDVFADSRILRESPYDAKLESFVYGSIPTRYLESVTIFSENDLSKFEWKAIPAGDRAAIIADYRLKVDLATESRFSALMFTRRKEFCGNLLSRSHPSD